MGGKKKNGSKKVFVEGYVRILLREVIFVFFKDFNIYIKILINIFFFLVYFE